MISLANAALKIYVALDPCDMRKGFNGLYASASQHLREGRLGVDQLFVFANKRRDRIKLLYFDGTGLWVAAGKGALQLARPGEGAGEAAPAARGPADAARRRRPARSDLAPVV